MALFTAAGKIELPFRFGGPRSTLGESSRHDALIAELEASQARERKLCRQVDELSRRTALLTDELSHRLFNGMQLIGTLLSAQSRLAPPEAATQLVIAVGRVVAFGQVHRRLHLLDHQEHVEFRQYLFDLCEELSVLLFGDQFGFGIEVEGSDVDLPTAIAVPLGFIVNEMITNSAKFAGGNIAVRLDLHSAAGCSLSVSDQGPGLPSGFNPAECDGLGTKIMLSLARRIGGELVISAGDHGRGCRFAVEFNPVVTDPEVMTPPVREEMPSLDPSRFNSGSDVFCKQTAVDRWVVQANIELFRAVLATETDTNKREIITSLLATEVEKTKGQ
jgi:two-component sensor histidine kinase